MTLESFELTRVLLLAALSFGTAFAWTPVLLRSLKRLKFGKTIRTEAEAPVYAKLHAGKKGTPTMGGVLVWGTVLFLALVLSQIHALSPDSFLGKLDFLSRSETWLPLAALVASAVVGLLDDYYNIRGLGAHGGGLRARHRLLIYTLIAMVGAWWFHVKLEKDLLHIPFVGDAHLGPLYVPFFIFIIVTTGFSVNETDGLDGLAGGTLFTSFGALAIIAFAQGRYDLAAFCAVIIGALLAFLWFNIYPASFFMGDTGSMSLGVTLGIVAMLTDSALWIPVIGVIFALESASVLLQIASRKLFGRKIFLSAPFHHHLEAIGWPEPKIVMRLWVVSMVAAALGAAFALLDALH